MSDGDGNCYEVAFKLLVGIRDGPELSTDAVLVHAEVAGQGVLDGYAIGHAWIEDHELAFDESNGRHIVLPTMLYRSAAGISMRAAAPKLYTYTQEEARKRALEVGTFGPWDLKPLDGPIKQR